MSNEFFNYCVGNPPYQLDIQGEDASRRRSEDIFPNFQRYGSYTSLNTLMVYPGTWQKDIKRAFPQFLLQNGLKQSTFFNGEKIFDKGITQYYPITITIAERDYEGNILVNDHLVPRDVEVWVEDEERLRLVSRVRDLKKISGAFHLTNMANIATSEIDPNKFHHTNSGMTNPILIYIKRDPGTQQDGADRFIERATMEPLLRRKDVIDKFIVGFPAAPIARGRVFNSIVQGNKQLGGKVFEPGHIFAKTYIQVHEPFDTSEEAKNFAKYVNTTFFLKLASLDITQTGFGRYIPDLEDYTNKNSLFKRKPSVEDLDSRLYKYFN